MIRLNQVTKRKGQAFVPHPACIKTLHGYRLSHCSLIFKEAQEIYSPVHITVKTVILLLLEYSERKILI